MMTLEHSSNGVDWTEMAVSDRSAIAVYLRADGAYSDGLGNHYRMKG